MSVAHSSSIGFIENKKSSKLCCLQNQRKWIQRVRSVRRASSEYEPPLIDLNKQCMKGLTMVGHMKVTLVQAIGQKNILIVGERLKVPSI